MSDESDDIDIERLVDLATEIREYLPQFKQAIVGGDHDGELGELAQNLWEVVDEAEDILETADFEELPDAIDVDDLPKAIDVEDVPEGLFSDDENAIELTDVREAVNLRELWDAVDLTQLYQEKQELEDEMDDVTDQVDGDKDEGMLDDVIESEDDGPVDDDDELFDDVVGFGEGANVEFDVETRQAFIEEKIQDAVEKFRELLLETHEKLRKLYELNQEKLGQPGRQPDSLNPTAYSTLPSGPVPNSVSTRASTVPTQVKYSRVDNPRRIYGHRFHEATGDDERSDSEEGDGQTDDEDEEITLEVYDE